jgi:Protein of unknown function (DUF3037)
MDDTIPCESKQAGTTAATGDIGPARSNPMEKSHNAEFFLLRYMPDVARGEFANIGIVVISQAEDGSLVADLRSAKNWQRIRAFFPKADIKFLQALLDDIKQQLANAPDRAQMLRLMKDSFSNSIGLSAEQSFVLTEDFKAEIERLADMYLS